MKRLLISASLAASVILPSAALAQATPAALIAVVDQEKVVSNCNACKTASAALRAQATAEENREKALVTPLQTEQRSIQAAIDALGGKEPDAALKSRVQAFQAKQQQAQETASSGRQQLQANQQYIQRQIGEKLGPIYSQVMQKRGANTLIEVGQTLASSAGLDVTTDVVTALNAALPAIQAVAPAQPQRQTPPGR